MVLCWQAWAGVWCWLTAAFVHVHRIVRDFRGGVRPGAASGEQDPRLGALARAGGERGARRHPSRSPAMGRAAGAAARRPRREARQALDVFEAIEALPFPAAGAGAGPGHRQGPARSAGSSRRTGRASISMLCCASWARDRMPSCGCCSAARPAWPRRLGRVTDGCAGHPAPGGRLRLVVGRHGHGLVQKMVERAPGSVWDLILAHRTAGLLLVLDDEKSGGSERNGDLERLPSGPARAGTVGSLLDPYLEVPVDLSGMSVILTANSLHGLSRPLLDRLQAVEVPSPGPEHLEALAWSLLRTVYRERTGDERSGRPAHRRRD